MPFTGTGGPSRRGFSSSTGSRARKVRSPASESPCPRAPAAPSSATKIKRQLREVWRSRLESLPPAHDFVLIVRPGLVEGTEAKGFEWLGERVDEVLGKAAA